MRMHHLLLIAATVLGGTVPSWAQSDMRVYPAGCFDRYGRPLNPDPANPANSADPSCRPPDSGVVMRGAQPGATSPSAGAPSMQPGSVNLPPTPVPLPGGIGVMSR